MDDTGDTIDPKPPRSKRPVTQAQREALERGRATRAANKLKRKEEAARAAEEIREEDEEHSDADAGAPVYDPFKKILEKYPEGRHEKNRRPIEDIARDTQFVSPRGEELPEDESDPHKRQRATFEVEDRAGDDFTPATLDDLMAMAPIGDGQYYITVDRKEPRVWGGVPCAGIQPPITVAMTRRDFRDTYGGGRYELILYGPPKSGAGVIDPQTGRVRPKRLSPRVVYTEPLSSTPPSLNVQEADEDDESYPEENGTMRAVPSWSARRPATPADAKIYDSQLQHEERIDDKREAREREARDREARLQAEAEARGITYAQLVAEKADRDADRQERREREERQRIERDAREKLELAGAARSATDPAAMMSSVATLIKAVKPEGNGAATEVQIKQMAESYRTDLDRVTRAHQEDMRREQDRATAAERRADERVTDIERRCEERIKSIEQKCEERIREGSERSERRVREVEDQSRKTLEDDRRASQQRLDDERRQHERDLKSKDEQWTMRLETQKTSTETRLASKDEEINRLRMDLAQAKKDAEKNKDLLGRLQEFDAAAEAMGYQKGGDGSEEPLTWQQMLMKIGLQLPEMLKTAGETVLQARGQVTPQVQHAQMMTSQPGPMVQQYAPLPSQPQVQSLPFATEDGPAFAVPLPHQHEGSGLPGTYPPGYGPNGPVAQAPQRPPPQQARPRPQPAPPPAPPPQQAPAQPPQQQQPAAPITVSAEQIQQFRPFLESAITSGATPRDFAQEFVKEVSAPVASQICMMVTPEAISTVVRGLPGGAASPLVRREGQKWLKEVWSIVKQITAAQ